MNLNQRSVARTSGVYTQSINAASWRLSLTQRDNDDQFSATCVEPTPDGLGKCGTRRRAGTGRLAHAGGAGSSGTGCSIAAASFNNGSWETLISGAKGKYLWRPIGIDGNATADPVFISISVQFR